MEDESAVQYKTMVLLSVVLLIAFGVAVGAAVYDHRPTRSQHSSVLNHDGTWDINELNRRNLDQTGVWDRGIPLPMRQDRARELGYDPPNR